MSKITKLNILDPDSKLMIIENGTINGNTISINPEFENDIFLPSMYKSWTYPQAQHIQFKFENTDQIPSQNNILFIFDTWGCSSYYHLLIDHIIPVWITKQVVKQYLLERPQVEVDGLSEDYLRISKNSYNNELQNTNDIFMHFLGKHFTEQINCKFKYIVYGYCNTYRPFHGGEIKYYPNYQKMIDSFLLEFVRKPEQTQSTDQYILLMKRDCRNFIDLDDDFLKLMQIYNVKMVDFSKYSIQEQIELCSNAYAMIGCEGAAFSNQLFLKPHSLLISICQDPTRNNFHTALTQYLNHDFHSIVVCDSYSQTAVINHIIHIINSHKDPSGNPFSKYWSGIYK